MAIEENWIQINKDVKGHEFPHCDYEVFPASPWNFGFLLEESNFKDSITFEEKQLTAMPFLPENAPVCAYVKGKKVNWGSIDGVPHIKPYMSYVDDKIYELKLIPYGCTNIRMTEMPLVK